MRLSIVLALGLALIGSENVRACLTVSSSPISSVSIKSEDVILVWDNAKKIEHFVRRVSFQTKSSDLGFIVPVPTKPELGEVTNDAFQRAFELGFSEPDPAPVAAANGNGALLQAALSRVSVIEEKRVAGMDAAVLEATSIKDLAEWLKKHGYVVRPSIQKWLEPYVNAHFKLVAFKYPKESPGKDTVSTAAVRISFPAPNLYFPYREPSDADAKNGRRLRIAVFSTQPATGYLYDGTKKPWPGASTALAMHVAADYALSGVVSPVGLPDSMWLTTFTDSTLVRPDGVELFFERAH